MSFLRRDLAQERNSVSVFRINATGESEELVQDGRKMLTTNVIRVPMWRISN